MAVSFSNPRDKLAAARLLACNRFRYFRVAIMSMVPKEVVGLGTFATTRDGIMLWDAERVKEWTVEQIAAVIVHEVSHLLRKHSDRCERMGADAANWNVAADAEINDDLAVAKLSLPGDCVYPSKLGMKDGLTAEEYYHQMKKKAEKQKGKGKGQQQDQQEKPSEGEGGDEWKAKPGVGQGRCGGCAGHPEEEEKQHSKGAKGRSERELEGIRRTVAEEIRKEAEKGQGTIPGSWKRWAEEQLAPPKVPWQQKLARAVRGGVAFRPGAVDLTHSRISRRQAGVGFGPGKPVLSALYAPQPRVAVVVDTSGSMGADELKRAVSECKGILAAVGAAVEFCACDAQVHELRPVQRWQEVTGLLKGGGGTSFVPAFEAMEKKVPKPDVLIFITDGMGPAPQQPPPFKTIWVLVGPYKAHPCSWGEQIEVDS